MNPAAEARLDRLAAETGRAKAFNLRSLIEAALDDVEDAYLGAAVVERIRLGKERTYNLAKVAAELGLDQFLGSTSQGLLRHLNHLRQEADA